MISTLQVLRSAAGYYIGREEFDAEMEMWIPYSRNSEEYFRSYEDAENAMKTGNYTVRYDA